MSLPFAQVVFGLPLEGPYDYSVPEKFRDHIKEGQRVEVIFNHQKLFGFIVGFLKKPSVDKQIKPILNILDGDPVLDAPAFKLTKEFSAYYGCSWGEAIETYLPPVLRLGRVTREKFIDRPLKKVSKTESILIVDPQLSQCWETINAEIKFAVDDKKSVIFFVPDSSYFDEVLSKIKSNCPVMKLESRPTSASLLQWTKLRSTCPVLLIGKRSAAFAPLDNLGLVIIFEEDDRSYKQDQSPHYHVHDVVAMRQKLEGFKTIYVSQAPTAETWYEAKKNKWKIISHLAKDAAQVQMINMDNYDKQKGYIFSPPVMNDIQNCIAQKKRILLFFNKKSKTVMGENKAGIMAPYLSTGVEKLATTVSKLFPDAVIGKYQKETSGLNARANVVIATQAVLRLRYQEKFDYVVFLNVDAELSHMNFRSSHITYALLTKLRAMAKEKILFQTRMPNNYVLESFSKGVPEDFYTEELNIREQLKFPPYAHIVAIKLRAKKEDAVKKTSKEIFEALKEKVPEDIELVDPYADMMGVVIEKFKYTIQLKGQNVKRILAFVKETLPNIKSSGNVIVTFDVDP